MFTPYMHTPQNYIPTYIPTYTYTNESNITFIEVEEVGDTIHLLSRIAMVMMVVSVVVMEGDQITVSEALKVEQEG